MTPREEGSGVGLRVAGLLALVVFASCNGGGDGGSSAKDAAGAPPGDGAETAQSSSALCGTAAGSAPEPAKDTIRVANLNVLHGLDETPEYPAHSTLDRRLELAARALDSRGVDLVGVQEVSLTEANDETRHRPGLVAERLAENLAGRTGTTWHWCWFLSNPHLPAEPDLRPGGGGPLSDEIAKLASSRYASFKEGIAILSRYPILGAEGRRLPGRVPAEAVFCPPTIEVPPICPSTVLIESRAALWAEIDTPGGRTQIVTTHLSHDLTEISDASTLEQAAVVLAFADEKAGSSLPARRFLTCDCNVQESDAVPVIALITAAGWTDTYASLHPTLACRSGQDTAGCTSDQDILAAASTTTERIDYVFGREGSCPLGLRAGEKIASMPSFGEPTPTSFLWASDHHGVAADVETACPPS